VHARTRRNVAACRRSRPSTIMGSESACWTEQRRDDLPTTHPQAAGAPVASPLSPLMLLACETAPCRRRPPTRNVVTRSLITICLARQGIIDDVGHYDPIPRKMPPPPPEHTLLESSPVHSERTLWSEHGLFPDVQTPFAPAAEPARPDPDQVTPPPPHPPRGSPRRPAPVCPTSCP
jgi:hypothetical protein